LGIGLAIADWIGDWRLDWRLAIEDWSGDFSRRHSTVNAAIPNPQSPIKSNNRQSHPQSTIVNRQCNRQSAVGNLQSIRR
jgi:hypothetical protein